MSFNIIEGDITKLDVDAIVNAANSSLLGGGGVDGAIHKAAGEKLLEECRGLGGCKTGDAKLTKGYNLLAKYVIHTVGPIWRSGEYGEEKLLRSCYKNSLKIAKDKNLKSIAFSLISSGVYGYPMAGAIDVAISEIKKFLNKNDMKIILVIFNRESFVIPNTSLRKEISNILNKENKESVNKESVNKGSVNKAIIDKESIDKESIDKESIDNKSTNNFYEDLIDLTEEKNISLKELYKKANIDEAELEKIESNNEYYTSKNILLSFVIAFKFSLKEMETLLEKYGYKISYDKRYDLIIKYFVENERYDIFEINIVLFAYKENLLGF
ncbi:O-acetyl-ADP-ribose deacetylase [Peptostreptococcus russellii]|uniref:O-acetyl-ADP-ribose deacetylase n=1 Tax=Peptostreptococcus russellii TaxID=215200 RepID=UPI003F582AB0